LRNLCVNREHDIYKSKLREFLLSDNETWPSSKFVSIELIKCLVIIIECKV